MFTGRLGAIATPILVTWQLEAVDTVMNNNVAMIGLPAMERRPKPPIANMVMLRSVGLLMEDIGGLVLEVL